MNLVRKVLKADQVSLVGRGSLVRKVSLGTLALMDQEEPRVSLGRVYPGSKVNQETKVNHNPFGKYFSLP